MFLCLVALILVSINWYRLDVLPSSSDKNRPDVLPSSSDKKVENFWPEEAKGCPTAQEILALTTNRRSFRWQVWDDPTCSRGCKFDQPLADQLDLPFCVVPREVGYVKLAINLCIRQVESMLYTRLFFEDLIKMVKYCHAYVNIPLLRPSCLSKPRVIPHIIHTITGSKIPPATAVAAAQQNKDYALRHSDDEEGYLFIKSRCSLDAAAAYRCLKAPAFRADLYRFCALYAEGGVYLDADVLLLQSIDSIISTCSSFSMGYDQVQGELNIDHVGMQMKILASIPEHPISDCMVTNIVNKVRRRDQVGVKSLSFSGPGLLRECYLAHMHDVAVTYIDTRGAGWPYAGLRSGASIYAYEISDKDRHFVEVSEPGYKQDYARLAEENALYHDDCAL